MAGNKISASTKNRYKLGHITRPMLTILKFREETEKRTLDKKKKRFEEGKAKVRQL